MDFNPNNTIVKLCLQGMSMEEAGKPAEALQLFLEAWTQTTNDSERFIAAYYVARCQTTTAQKLEWYNTALRLAMSVNDYVANSALPALYTNIANCYDGLGDAASAEENRKLALVYKSNPSDKGPFYHGTRADLQVGDMLLPGHMSNYQSELQMNHIYFTALANGAGLAAALAKGDGLERVYIVEPTSHFENDPNVTDKKFPGNPTRSYRTTQPLKIVGELTEWVRQTAEEIQQWRDRLANNNGEIIN
jgi:rifampin ADP-ribosylating transferase